MSNLEGREDNSDARWIKFLVCCCCKTNASTTTDLWRTEKRSSPDGDLSHESHQSQYQGKILISKRIVSSDLGIERIVVFASRLADSPYLFCRNPGEFWINGNCIFYFPTIAGSRKTDYWWHKYETTWLFGLRNSEFDNLRGLGAATLLKARSHFSNKGFAKKLVSDHCSNSALAAVRVLEYVTQLFCRLTTAKKSTSEWSRSKFFVHFLHHLWSMN